MVNFLDITFLTILLSSIILMKCDNKYEALHFSRNTFPRLTFDLALMKELEYPKLFYPSATACPAESEEEDAFDKDYSFSKNSMFIRDTYKENQTSQDVHYFICKKPYKLSVLYHNKNVEFQFGIEVYFDKSKYGDKGFLESYRGDYDLITNTYTYTNYIKPFFYYIPRGVPYLSRLTSLPLVSRFLQTPLYLDKNHTQELGFLWIQSFQMKFNFKAKRVAQSTYILALTTRGLHKCDDYDLGKEYFTGLDIDNLYGEDNQKIMLEGVKLPTSKDGDDYMEFQCAHENQCFAKWSTVPAEQFHHLATKSTSCSNLLTIPVWKSTIYEALNKLDNFLFAISMVLGHPIGNLVIHSGVHGVLRLPTGSQFWPTKPITLAEKAIEVPDIIYKLIKYKVMLCPMPKDELKRYYKSIRPKMKLEDIENESDKLIVPKSKPADTTNTVKNTDSNSDNSDENPHLLKDPKEELVDKNDGMKNSESSSDDEKTHLLKDLNNELVDKDDGMDKSDDNSDDDETTKLLKDSTKYQAYNNIKDDFPPDKLSECKRATSALIIVIHNNPNFNPEKDQICKDQCLKWGWEMVKQKKLGEEIITSKYIYCCQANEENVRKKLGIKYEHDTEVGSVYSSTTFSLKDVPIIYNFETNKFIHYNAHDLIVDAYKHIFEGAKLKRNKRDEMNALKKNYYMKASFLQIEEPNNDEDDEPDNSEIGLEDQEKTENLTMETPKEGDKK